MFRMRKTNNSLKACIALLPIWLSGAPLSARPMIGTLLLCTSIFLATAYVPLFKHRENLAVFLLVWLCGIPINLRLTVSIINFLELDYSVLYSIIYGSIVMLALFSIEEILFGIATRICWRRQYNTSFE